MAKIGETDSRCAFAVTSPRAAFCTLLVLLYHFHAALHKLTCSKMDCVASYGRKERWELALVRKLPAYVICHAANHSRLGRLLPPPLLSMWLVPC